MGQGHPKHKNRLGREWAESSPEEKDLQVLKDYKINMTQQQVLVVQKAKYILGCIKKKCGQWVKGGEISSSALLRPHLDY